MKPPRRRVRSRHRALTYGLGGLAAVAVAGAGGRELVSRGVLPGQQVLDSIDGACLPAAVPPAAASRAGSA